ncbi:MAG: stage IV sporulation protein A [Eubacteriales bacterium]|nr:stage IV sporulation protein A [Eubacteriales bacterium]MDD4583068.1 stage IV sporulation protein A [Eubacteriales bacterium]
MENLNIYESIAERTQGDIYIGVVGPVRTGKSTFIKRFMDLMVIPNVENSHVKERVRDELPQSGSGRTITTTEPKFVPADAVEVTLPDNTHFKVRMVDCVGYMVENAIGHLENDLPRMVNTPWYEERIPFIQAAEIGTRKVITDHSTIGILVTTDGSIGEIAREDFIPAEERVVKELAELKKPFVIILNSISPEEESVQELRNLLEEKYRVPVIAANCAKMSTNQLNKILYQVLNQFPAVEIGFHLPGFIEGLPNDHRIKATIITGIKDWCKDFNTVKDIKDTVACLADGEIVKNVTIKEMNLGTGSTEVVLEPVDGLFYQVISEITECEIENDSQFFPLIKELAIAKRAYDKLAPAMLQVESAGYGIVQPKLSEMTLEEPEIFKQGNKFGVRLKAKAPSLHIIKTDVTTEISPVVGSFRQSEDLVEYLLSEFESDPSKIWDTNIFGKSLYEMVAEQMETKLANVPENIRAKVQKSLEKVSNEGKEYMICIVL